MEFKKNWGIIWQIRMLMILCFALCSIFSITFFWCKEYRLAYSLMLSGLLMILLLYCAMLVLPGVLSDVVKISEKGISMQSVKNGDSIFPWNEIEKITQSRKFGTNIFILLNNSGEEMWFYSSKKIKKYMIAVYPPIESLFV
ncbi:MAG: hypothetical protein SPE18_11175 [Candidatus Limivicinus sp.]|nr:hypothetical protein [Candidatus Limivicinus sp.]